MLKRLMLGAAMAFAATASAQAITVDGTRDSAYGGPTATVAYDPAALESNFGQPGFPPGAASKYVGYDIYLHGSNGYVYGFLEADGPTGGLDFANLYWNVDLTNNVGSDLGFHITSKDAFVPPNGGYSATPGIAFAFGLNSIEFAIPVAYFTGFLPGLDYSSNFNHYTLPAAGNKIQLSLSQSFGYSVAGGLANFGADRLGVVALSAAPEPEAWALMILGFGAAGAVLRERRTRVAA